MRNWVITKNNGRIDLNSIPELTIQELRLEIIKMNKRVIAFFGQNWSDNKVKLFVVLADDKNAELYVSSALFLNN